MVELFTNAARRVSATCSAAAWLRRFPRVTTREAPHAPCVSEPASGSCSHRQDLHSTLGFSSRDQQHSPASDQTRRAQARTGVGRPYQPVERRRDIPIRHAVRLVEPDAARVACPVRRRLVGVKRSLSRRIVNPGVRSDSVLHEVGRRRHTHDTPRSPVVDRCEATIEQWLDEACQGLCWLKVVSPQSRANPSRGFGP